MVKIRPLTGYVAKQDIAGQLLAPAYDTLNTEEARAMAGDNQVSFLRVNKPEIDLPPETDPYSEEVYLKGKENLQKFVQEGWLVEEAQPTLYIYGLNMGELQQFGIVAGASVQEYEDNIIKKHELTVKKKEADRTKLTDVQGANVGPVFLAYRNKEDIDAVVNGIISREPFIDVTMDDQVRHRLWKANPEENTAIVASFDTVPELYIADGHHRSASAFNVGKMRKERAGEGITGEEEFNFFLAIFYPHNQLNVMDYNRVLRTFGGERTADQFLEELKQNFDIIEITDPKPKAKGQFSLYINKQWIGLQVKPEKVGEGPIAGLDSQILTDLCFTPLLGITTADLREQKDIDFVGGLRGIGELEKRCNEDCVAAFALYPVGMQEVFDIADAGAIMPPKTTWFEPKPRSGLVVNIFK